MNYVAGLMRKLLVNEEKTKPEPSKHEPNEHELSKHELSKHEPSKYESSKPEQNKLKAPPKQLPTETPTPVWSPRKID